MIFTTAQLEIIATLSHARAPAAQICEALGISEAEFAAWHQRLAMGRSYVEPVSIPSKPVRQLPERLRFRAERIFENATEAPQPRADAAEIEAAVRRYSC